MFQVQTDKIVNIVFINWLHIFENKEYLSTVMSFVEQNTFIP